MSVADCKIPAARDGADRGNDGSGGDDPVGESLAQNPNAAITVHSRPE